MRDDFCAFILSHGRPDSVYTYDTLKRSGYTGKVYIVIDDEDIAGDLYRKRFGDKVLVFSKSEVAQNFDEGDNTGKMRSTSYVRNAFWGLAKSVGCKHFIQLDDDYADFGFRYNSRIDYEYRTCTSTLDGVWSAMLDFMESTPITSICMAQGGDFIGGNPGKCRLRRKAMNSFICSTDRPFTIVGRLNEDVNTYVTLGSRGSLFFTTVYVYLSQKATQATSGGMTEAYLDSGTYQKSFFTVMYHPSSVKVGVLRDPRGSASRIHHEINWERTVPKILHERHRKTTRGE